MRILFISNQGGIPVVDLNCSIASECRSLLPSIDIMFAVWWRAEADRVREQAPLAKQVHTYQDFIESLGKDDWKEHVDRINRDYPNVNWSAVIASERSFSDSSFLIGAGGNRREDYNYVQRVLVNGIRFFERVLAIGIDAIVCQTADSLFTHVMYKVAARFDVRILAINSVWLAEQGEGGFCLAADEYTHVPAMIKHYRLLRDRLLNAAEVDRSEVLRKIVLGFDVGRVVAKVARRRYVIGPLSPNIYRLPFYLLENFRKNKEVDYQRFDVTSKVKANMLRLWRKWRTAPLLGRQSAQLPEQYVLLALHFQPEQSSLVGGIYYTNQIALAENVAKSLPLGWTLVIKEHPKGRGSRPAWQYRHLASFPNVVFSDAPIKRLLSCAGAVITITGTIAIEAMAMDRPAIIFGQTYFDYADVLYKPGSVSELGGVLRRILIEREYEQWNERTDLIRKFLLSYALGLRPGFPTLPNAARVIAASIVESLSEEGSICAG